MVFHWTSGDCTNIFLNRHVLDGAAGQKFESTWPEGKLSNWLDHNFLLNRI
jgi:hypothetical protein